MLLPILSLLAGFILLMWSADTFTDNGAKIARIFNISPLIIGLLIFGFGTSAPEMLVSGLAAYAKRTWSLHATASHRREITGSCRNTGSASWCQASGACA